MQPSSASRSRPQTAGSRPRSSNVQAFQRGKDAAQLDALEMCRSGLTQVSAQLLSKFQSELQQLGSALEHQVLMAIESQLQKSEEKFDSILQALRRSEIGRGRSESPKQSYFAGLAYDCGQIEANRKLVKRREEQINQMLVVLEKLEQSSTTVENYTRALEGNVERTAAKVDMLDSYVRTTLAKEGDPVVSPRTPRSQKLERSESQQFMKKSDIMALQQQLAHETEHDVDELYKEIETSRKLASNNFRAMIKEVSRIQQALNLDFVVASDSDESESSTGLGMSRRPSISLSVRAAPSSPERSGTPSALAVALDVPVAAAPAPAAPAAEAAEAPVTTVTTVAEESRGSREVEFRPRLATPELSREDSKPRRSTSKPSSRARSPSAGERGEDGDVANFRAVTAPVSMVPVPAKRFKRVREFWTQTQRDLEERGAQTDPMRIQKQKTEKSAAFTSFFNKKEKSQHQNTRGVSMNDLDAMKARARKAVMRPQYDVTNCYKNEGCFQAIARSSVFDQLTVLVVCVNAVWIAVDTDSNTAFFLYEADPIFQIVENVFCTYFFLEICIRFGAFEKKCNALMDKWFMFDAILVLNMVVETWLLPLMFVAMGSEDFGNTIDVSMLRMLRLVKLTRLSRISRLLRSVPELAIIVKAIGLSARSVCVFFALWLVLIYVFAITLRQLTSGTEFGETYFQSVPQAMDTLLLDGILADYAPLMHAIPAGHFIEWGLILFFILLASITIMYMLVGVLVEVVGVLAHAEKENITVSFIASSLRKKMQQQGHDQDSELSRTELQDILLDPEITEVLQSVQVDLVALMELVNIAYEDAEKNGGSMTFEKMVSLVLNGRGQNTASVKDTSELLRILKQIIIQRTSEMSEKFHDEIAIVHRSIQFLREDPDSGVAEEDSPKDEESSSKKERRNPRGDRASRKFTFNT